MVALRSLVELLCAAVSTFYIVTGVGIDPNLVSKFDKRRYGDANARVHGGRFA